MKDLRLSHCLKLIHPGYYWNPRTHTLFSDKRGNYLMELRLHAASSFNNYTECYSLSIDGQRLSVRLEALVTLSPTLFDKDQSQYILSPSYAQLVAERVRVVDLSEGDTIICIHDIAQWLEYGREYRVVEKGYRGSKLYAKIERVTQDEYSPKLSFELSETELSAARYFTMSNQDTDPALVFGFLDKNRVAVHKDSANTGRAHTSGNVRGRSGLPKERKPDAELTLHDIYKYYDGIRESQKSGAVESGEDDKAYEFAATGKEPQLLFDFSDIDDEDAAG